MAAKDGQSECGRKRHNGKLWSSGTRKKKASSGFTLIGFAW